MAEKVANGLELGPLTEKVQCQSMPQAVRSAAQWQGDAGVLCPRTERVSDGAASEWTDWDLNAEEDLAAAHGRPPVTQVIEERRPDLIGERQEQRRADFGPLDTDLSRPPGDVVEIKRADLARAQAVGGDEKEHRVVASTLLCRAVDRSQERTDRLPWQGARKPLAAPDAR